MAGTLRVEEPGLFTFDAQADQGVRMTSVLTMAPRSSVTLTYQVLAAAGGLGAEMMPSWIVAATEVHFRLDRRPVSAV